MSTRKSSTPEEIVSPHNRLGSEAGITVLPLMIRTAFSKLFKRGKRDSETPVPEDEYCLNPIRNPTYMEALSNSHPKLAAEHTRYANQIKAITGVKSMSELSRLASRIRFATEAQDRHEAEQTLRKIRWRYMSCLGICDMYKDEHKEEGLRVIANQAETIINRSLNTHLGPVQHMLESHMEVSCIDDPARLMLRSFDEDASNPKVRFEARRKLELMSLLGKLSKNHPHDINEEDEIQLNDKDYISKVETPLSCMTSFMERSIFERSGEKAGHTVTRYLISRHRKKDYTCSRATFQTDVPEDKGMQQITPMELRKAFVRNERGESREIEFYVHSRRKNDVDAEIKRITQDKNREEELSDANGIRFVFETESDIDDFFKMFEEKLKKETKEDLELKRDASETEEEKDETQKRIDGVENLFKKNNPINTLNGEKFKGTGGNSASSLRIKKYNYRIERADGRVDEYEFQIMLPDSYADYLYGKKAAHEVYKHSRAKRILELLFPESVYNWLNEKTRDSLQENAKERAHRDVTAKNIDLNTSAKIGNGNGKRPSRKFRI